MAEAAPESEEQILNQLKEILFDEDKDALARFDREIQRLNEMLSDEKFSQKLDPIVQEKFDEIKKQVTKLSGADLSDSIRQQIRENRDEMIDSLYPIMGQLVKKYIQIELEKLVENINQQIDNTLSWDSIRREFLSLFGIKEKDQLLKRAIAPTIEEIFVIEQDSGILLGHYSVSSAVDQDMIAGMLTAIKSFVADSFTTKDGSNFSIEQGEFKVIVQDFKKYYLAAVVAGVLDAKFKSNLFDKLIDFGEAKLLEVSGENREQQIAQSLKTYFSKINISD